MRKDKMRWEEMRGDEMGNSTAWNASSTKKMQWMFYTEVSSITLECYLLKIALKLLSDSGDDMIWDEMRWDEMRWETALKHI